MKRAGAKILIDKTATIVHSIQDLVSTRVMVGVPADDETKFGQAPIDPNNRPSDPISNAAIGYLAEHGAPEQNLPARPHLVPGVQGKLPDITKRLEQTLAAALDGDRPKVERGFHAVGLTAQAAVRNMLTSGLQPPLSSVTLRRRLARTPSRKGEAKELAARASGAAPSTDFVKPYIDTGQYKNSLSYILKKISKA